MPLFIFREAASFKGNLLNAYVAPNRKLFTTFTFEKNFVWCLIFEEESNMSQP